MESFSINGFLQASYKYDAMGRQAIRTLTSPAPVTIHSVFDSQGRRIAEYNETSGALIREYVWHGWEPVAVIEGGVVSFVRADHIGRPVFATNASGAKVWEVSYLPFGGVRIATGSPTASRFPGQWYQTESGLHQNWMRDYDPTTGRYLQPDPLGLIDGASVYGYAGQSPMMNMDPTGECFGPAAVLLPVCVWAAWMVYDYLTDPDCYTLSDFMWSAVMNADPFKAARWLKGWTRPKFRNQTPRSAWNNAEDGPNGGKKCPDCGREVFGDPNKGEPRGGPEGWDVNHEPKVKDRDYDSMTRPEQIDDYQTGTDLKCRSCNRKDNK